MKKQTAILILLALLLPMITPATTYYVAQTAGTFSGGSACNGQTAITLATWNSTALSPGDTTYVCGTITITSGVNGFAFSSYSGSSGNPISLIFDTGAILQAPYIGSDPFGSGFAGISCSGASYITVNGGTNGIIQSTANGSAALGYANQQGSQGIGFSNCPHAVIQNFTVQNIFIHSPGATDGGVGVSNTQCIGIGNSDFSIVHDNVANNCSFGIGIGYGPSGSGNLTSGNFYNNTINTSCHFLQLGTGGNNGLATALNFYGNTIGPDFNTWIDSGSACHLDGMIFEASNTNDSLTNFSVYNNHIMASACTAAGGNFTGYLFVSSGSGAISGWNIFNNLFTATVTTNGCSFQGFIVMGASGGATTTNFSIYNNTFDENSIPFAGTNNGVLMQGTMSGINIRNNIFQNFVNCGGIYSLQSSANPYSTAMAAVDYNNYYNIQCKYAHDDDNGQDYITFANWQTPNAINSFPGYDAHGVVGNPLLNVNYVPQSGSSAIGIGANLTSLCTGALTALCSDAAGNARPSSGAWTVGAYNLASPPASIPSAPAPQMFVWNGSLSTPISLSSAGQATGTLTGTLKRTVKCTCTVPSSGKISCVCQ